MSLNGEEKDAVNYPSTQRIVVNRSRFKSYEESLLKETLALHEVLGLAKIDDLNFEKSSHLIGYDPIARRIAMSKVDIVFVVDDSASMQVHQQNLAAQIEYLVRRIDDLKADYHIGVITTSESACLNGDNPEVCGAYLHSSDDYGYPTHSFVTAFTPNRLAQLRRNLIVGTQGDPDEQPFASIHRALTTPVVDTVNNGFYREDARLEIVILTDANEQSSIAPSQLVTFLTSLKKGQKDRIGVSVFLPLPGDKSCPSEDHEIDYSKYYGLMTPFHGGMYNLCNTVNGEEIRNFADDVNTRLQPKP